MELNQRDRIRLAVFIESQLQQHWQQRYQEILQGITAVTGYQRQLELSHQGLGKCLRRQWQGAAQEITTRIQQVVQELPYTLEQLDHRLRILAVPRPTLREIYQELGQLPEEFDRVEYDLREKILSVFTEPIELEGVYLGDFELRLDLAKLDGLKNAQSLRVIALDPHPASTNENVTHPHVSDQYLCMGDAQAPMQQALLNGRLCDFFLMARAVLENYNPSSPYVSLSDWEGICCYACGYTVCEEDTYYCEQCEETFCQECMGYCDCCQRSYCQGCLTECPVCGESRCEDCMVKCSACGEPVCKSCLEDELCPSCKEESENTDEDESESERKESLPEFQPVA